MQAHLAASSHFLIEKHFGTFRIKMAVNIHVATSAQVLGKEAGQLAATLIQEVIDQRGSANIILATGASQFETLAQLIQFPIPWQKVHMFHLDEYIGLDESHDASFRKYLKNRFLGPIGYQCHYHLIDGNNDTTVECQRLALLIEEHPIDVALIGIGENGHLAFNDPPADFDTLEPYITVQLDEACRSQQVGEGWFADLNEVPISAISMSVHQILRSDKLVVSVPDERKAEAVQKSMEGPISNLCPASILQKHSDCHLFLDEASASKLKCFI